MHDAVLSESKGRALSSENRQLENLLHELRSENAHVLACLDEEQRRNKDLHNLLAEANEDKVRLGQMLEDERQLRDEQQRTFDGRGQELNRLQGQIS